MKKLNFILKMMILFSFSILISCNSKNQKDAKSKEVNDEPTTKVNEYLEVNPTELSFEIRDYNYDGTIVSGGGVKPINGNIGQFLCEGVPLALKSSKFEDGFVVTQNYGKIKVIFGASLYGESYAIYLTSDQKEALSSLKNSGNNSVSAENEYHPVHYTELLFAF